MATFGTDYNADIVSLNYVVPTLQANTLFIPGITTPAEMVVSAESAYYYESTEDAVSDGTAGRKLDLSETGFKRYDIPLTKSVAIAGIVPNAARQINGVDPVNVKAVEFALRAVKKHNALGVAEMVKSGTAKESTALTAATIYASIVDLKAEFLKTNNGIEPTYIIVSPETEALLLKSPEFIRKEQANDAVVYTGVIGRVAGLVVLRANDLADAEYIMGCESSFLAPTSLRGMQIITQVPGYVNGVAIQDENGYGFKVTKQARLLVKKAA